MQVGQKRQTSLRRMLWSGFVTVLAVLVAQGALAVWTLSRLNGNEARVIADVSGLVEDIYAVRENSQATAAQAKELSESVRTGLVKTMKDGAGDLRVLERSVNQLVQSTGAVIKKLEAVLDNENLDDDTAGVIEDLIFDTEDGYDRGRKESLPVVRSVVARLLQGVEEANDTAERIAGLDNAMAQVAVTSKAVAEQGDSARGVARQSREHAATSQTLITLVSGFAALLALVIPAVIIRRLSRLFRDLAARLREGAEQVNDAAGQVSGASQVLAEGASEQASSLEETSSALEQMASMTRTNAENAKEANSLSEQARAAAESGDGTMEQLRAAMAAINESSGQISKIIKVIEEIAFQTNLLALNAAVEAARAGEHGKGFAVVADEVRNLAQRAAQAASETTALIEDSVNKAREGTGVAREVGEALGAIVGDVAKVSELIGGITRASEEQAQGVEQVNSAVAQMDKVTQQNASGAEESASAAEELAAQAGSVRGIVEELVATVGGTASGAATDTSRRARKRNTAQPDGKRPSARGGAPAGGSAGTGPGVGKSETSEEFVPL